MSNQPVNNCPQDIMQNCKILNDKDAYYRMVFDHMPGEIHHWKLIFDENGKIKTWALLNANPPALNSWDKKLANIIGKTTEEIFPNSNPVELFMPIVEKVFRDNKPHQWNEYFPDTNQHLQMTTAPLPDGSFLSMGFDVSERIENEKKLAVEKKKAEDASMAKSAYLQNMSHELRTPMNGILGFAQILEETDLNSEQMEFLRSIIASGKSLINILGDILNSVSIESGKLKINEHEFTFYNLLKDLEGFFKPQIELNGSEIIFEKNENLLIKEFFGDSLRIKQIIYNLVGNAVKFSPAGKIQISVTKIKNGVCIEVKDNGKGIDTDKLEDIFKIFEKVNRDKTKIYPSTGLGLFIVKSLVDLMKGSVSVNSKKTKEVPLEFYCH